MSQQNYELTDNAEAKQYEFHIDNLLPKIEYIKAQDKIYLTHTEVPTALEGKGIGSSLVRQVLEDIEAKELTLVPLCPFVALYLKRHPEWRRLVMKGINIE
jgi:predicted GNAT family acetyltransferase